MPQIRIHPDPTLNYSPRVISRLDIDQTMKVRHCIELHRIAMTMNAEIIVAQVDVLPNNTENSETPMKLQAVIVGLMGAVALVRDGHFIHLLSITHL